MLGVKQPTKIIHINCRNKKKKPIDSTKLY